GGQGVAVPGDVPGAALLLGLVGVVGDPVLDVDPVGRGVLLGVPGVPVERWQRGRLPTFCLCLLLRGVFLVPVNDTATVDVGMLSIRNMVGVGLLRGAVSLFGVTHGPAPFWRPRWRPPA